MDMSGFEDDERRRVTSALHEEIGQALTALRFRFATAKT